MDYTCVELLEQLHLEKTHLPPPVAAYVTYLMRKLRVSPLSLSDAQQQDIIFLSQRMEKAD